MFVNTQCAFYVAQNQSAFYVLRVARQPVRRKYVDSILIHARHHEPFHRNHRRRAAAALALTPATAHASACDASQQIRLSVGDRQIDR